MPLINTISNLPIPSLRYPFPSRERIKTPVIMSHSQRGNSTHFPTELTRQRKKKTTRQQKINTR